MSLFKFGLIGKTPPGKLKDIFKHLVRTKQKKPDLPDVFPASQAPIPPIKEDVKLREAVNRFVRDNPRQQKAGGGMLVQPGFGGTRQGYREEARFKQEGLKTRVSDKMRNLIEKKQPINPKTGKVYTMKEYASLTRGQKDKLSSRLRDKFKSKVRSPRLGYYPEKDANKLINFLKIAADKQKNNNVPLRERTFISVIDKGKFVGVRDVRANTLYTHIDYKGKRKGTSIALHPSQDEVLSFLKEAKKFKFEKPDRLLGSYFSKFERVPTYSEIYNFFNRDRNAPIKSFKQNALEIHHRNLIEKMPDKKFQLVTMRKNTEANRILNALNNKQITKKEADAALKKLGVNLQGMGKKDITTGKSIASAKRETVKLFKDALKENPNIADDIAKKLQIQRTLASFGDGTCAVQFGKGNKDGDRIGYATGTASLNDCIASGTKNFNDGKFKTADQVQDAAKLLRGGRAVISGLMKYGIIPELAYVGLEAAGRTLLGEKPTNSLLKSIDTLTFGATDFGSGIEAEKFGKFSDQKLAVDKFRNSQTLVNSLQNKLKNLEDINDQGGEGYVGDLSSDIQMTQAQLQRAQKSLQENTVSSDIVQFIDKRGQEIADTELAKSRFSKAGLKDQLEGIPGISDYTGTEPARIFPKQRKVDLNLDMFPQFSDATNFMQLKTDDAIDLAQSYRSEGKDVSAKDILAYRDSLRNAPLSELAKTYGDEQIYGTQGADVLQPLAGGGIAKLAGVDSGPPPASGPNSQGLQGLMKRVKRM